MQINIALIENTDIALIQSDQIVFHHAQDALQLLMDCHYQGASGLIVAATNIHPDFFDLKTGLAGDILQKFSNYDKKLAIVGDFSIYTSKSLHHFMYESNRVGRIFFVNSMEEAEARLRTS